MLVIAGTDSSGGAGLTRDMKVLSHFDLDVLYAITAVTAQSDARVTNVHHVPPQAIRAQIRAALDTRPVAAIKIGMLGTCATVEAVVESLPRGTAIPIVLDPVLVASSGGVLLDPKGRTVMCKRLFPRATIVTPNVPEAALLLREDPEIGEEGLIVQAQRLLALGPQAVLLKGGHASGEEAVDLLISEGVVQRITSPRVHAIHRGTGCALASAIAAGLAYGVTLLDACQQAKHYVLGMMSHADCGGRGT